MSQFLLKANCFKVGSTNKLDNFNKEKALCAFIIVSLSKLDRWLLTCLSPGSSSVGLNCNMIVTGGGEECY